MSYPSSETRGQIVGVRDTDKTGEKPGASESLQDGRESPWAMITFNGLVQEPICVLASD